MAEHCMDFDSTIQRKGQSAEATIFAVAEAERNVDLISSSACDFDTSPPSSSASTVVCTPTSREANASPLPNDNKTTGYPSVPAEIDADETESTAAADTPSHIMLVLKKHFNENLEQKGNGDEREEISERNRENIFYLNDGSERTAMNQNGGKAVYLETPVLEDYKLLLDTELVPATAVSSELNDHHYSNQHHNHHHKYHHIRRRNSCSAKSLSAGNAAKPKRLSDEFSSSSDDSESVDDAIKSSYIASDQNLKSINVETIIAADSEEVATCLKLLQPGEQQVQILDDSRSPPAETVGNDLASPQCVSVADVVEELTNQCDEPQQHRIVITENNLFFAGNNSNSSSSSDPNSSDAANGRNAGRGNEISSNNDVQSMDALERRDFIREQEATSSSCLLRTDSLIINQNNGDEPRLNLSLIGNAFSQNVEQIMAAAQELEASDGIEIESSADMSTTPTSSRGKRSRLSGENAVGGLNLSKSLEKCLPPQAVESTSRGCDSARTTFYPLYSSDSTSSDNQFASTSTSTSAKEEKPGSSSLSNAPPSEKAAASTLRASNEASSSNCACSSNNQDNSDDTIEFFDLDEVDETDEEVEEEIENEEIEDEVVADPSGNKLGRCDCAGSSNNSKGSSPRTRNVWRFEDGPSAGEAGEASGAASASSSASTSYLRDAGEAENCSSVHPDGENTCAEWPCEATSENEEVCTCHDYSSDEEIQAEDELPSRDIDLSCFSMMEDVLNTSQSETPTSRNQRKRKLNEGRPSLSDDHAVVGDAVDRKRLALDCSLPAKSGTNLPSTPTTPMNSALAALRTPRSVIPTRDNPPPELPDWLEQFKTWSHVERLVAVDRLIELCEPTQVRHMMKVIEPQFQRDFISLLPKELALQVLSYLLPKDLLRAAQTCRSWRYLCDDNLLWKDKCKQSAICIESSTDRPKRGRVGSMPPISSPWKAAYMRQHIIEMNWRSRDIREPKVLKGHDDHVITCLQFSGNRIVSGSDDNTLKVWSAVTGKCLRTLIGHTGGVWSSQMSNNIIISGSTDRTLKVWNADNGQCIHTLTGHTSTVRCMHLHDKK